MRAPLCLARCAVVVSTATVVMALCAGCSVLGIDGGERIVDVSSGRRIDRDELLHTLRQSDYVLLGELHDNPLHHRRRGELIEALRPGALVAEQLAAGAQVRFGTDLRASLVEAGFDAKSWQWPLHEPVFAAAEQAGTKVVGGNLAREQARSIARGGEAAWPQELRVPLQAAPLSTAAMQSLDGDLVRGHCGHLSAQRLPGMRAAQRAKDASMLLALQRAGARPVVLVAGNGHVRQDYGVGQLLGQVQPSVRVASVGFIETGDTLPSDSRYTHVWVTAKASRTDPCLGIVPSTLR